MRVVLNRVIFGQQYVHRFVGVMELHVDFSQMALEVSHHGYLLVTHLTTQEHCCHTYFHAYWYMNVMRSSRLFRVSLCLENGSILMIWGCFSIVSNVIRSNYCCRRHTMHGNMVFSRDYIFPTPQKSRCLLGCNDIICGLIQINRPCVLCYHPPPPPP